MPGEAEGREEQEQGRPEQEGKDKVLSEERIAEMEDKLCEATEEKLAIDKAETVEGKAEEKPEAAGAVPDLVPDLVPQGEQEAQETDSLKDLDIVAVSEAQCGERMDSPDALDSPPEMPDSPASPASPAASPSLPSAPTSEPGSPRPQVTHPTSHNATPTSRPHPTSHNVTPTSRPHPTSPLITQPPHLALTPPHPCSLRRWPWRRGAGGCEGSTVMAQSCRDP